jgi:hypothetical protein
VGAFVPAWPYWTFSFVKCSFFLLSGRFLSRRQLDADGWFVSSLYPLSSVHASSFTRGLRVVVPRNIYDNFRWKAEAEAETGARVHTLRVLVREGPSRIWQADKLFINIPDVHQCVAFALPTPSVVATRQFDHKYMYVERERERHTHTNTSALLSDNCESGYPRIIQSPRRHVRTTAVAVGDATILCAFSPSFTYIYFFARRLILAQ